DPQDELMTDLEQILGGLLDIAVSKGIIEDDITSRDLFDTKLMGTLVPMPHEVRAKFAEKHSISPQLATDYYYKLSTDTDYIRSYRVKKDVRWKYACEYGELDVTINLSKPEKDPKAIAMAKTAPQTGYPKCHLCEENEGYAGRINHPARQNHRIIPLELAGEKWYLQYSPYTYYNEHCIIFNQKHTPMKIDRSTFEKLFDFTDYLPHYFAGSNADLPIVGGSILSHEHYQGGRYTFAMEKAKDEVPLCFTGFEDVSGSILHWPMSVIRLRGTDKTRIILLADTILSTWKNYTDEDAFVYAYTEGTPHNTVTPIARISNGQYELDLVLRSNITTVDHPLGLYHPHEELHHIKKENIGLIEVMGLAVLPSRLKAELHEIEERFAAGLPLDTEGTAKHADWFARICEKRSVNAKNITAVLQEEVGRVFEAVLEDAGVYSPDEAGMSGVARFLAAVEEN
ncbi:MAG: UDP-glucose--hexose-1-phosphate uridylyltransferase, partial [Clostridia bacterium]|nr:UDP-glucose--hexose-1-phosphate uridylyltransferase [Clostridia bacterium]